MLQQASLKPPPVIKNFGYCILSLTCVLLAPRCDEKALRIYVLISNYVTATTSAACISGTSVQRQLLLETAASHRNLKTSYRYPDSVENDDVGKLNLRSFALRCGDKLYDDQSSQQDLQI